MNFIVNRRAQIGKIVTSFPVMILIFFVIGIYIISAGFIYKIKEAPQSLSIEGVGFDDALLKEVKVRDQPMLIIDSLVKSIINDKKYNEIRKRTEGFRSDLVNEQDNRFLDSDPLTFRKELSKNLIELLKRENLDLFKGEKSCFILFTGNGNVVSESFDDSSNIYAAFEKGEVVASANDVENYKRAGLLNNKKFIIKDKGLGNFEVNLQYYYGKCLGGGK